MKLLATILAALALAMPVKALGGQGVTVLPNVVNAVVVGEALFLVHDDGSSTFLMIADLELVSPEPNVWGFPSVGFSTNPHSLSTTYENPLGSTTVTTNCKGMSAARCAQKHLEMVKAMQAVLHKT